MINHVARSTEYIYPLSDTLIRSEEFKISHTTTWRILCSELGLQRHKYSKFQKLKLNDHRHLRVIVKWAQEQLETDTNFHQKLFANDKGHFT